MRVSLRFGWVVYSEAGALSNDIDATAVLVEYVSSLFFVQWLHAAEVCAH